MEPQDTEAWNCSLRLNMFIKISIRLTQHVLSLAIEERLKKVSIIQFTPMFTYRPFYYYAEAAGVSLTFAGIRS